MVKLSDRFDVNQRKISPISVSVVYNAHCHQESPLACVADEHWRSLVAIPSADPNLLILMRHRAVVLELLGGLVLYAAFRAAMQGIGIVVGTVSLASNVGLAWSTESYNQPLSRVSWRTPLPYSACLWRLLFA